MKWISIVALLLFSVCKGQENGKAIMEKSKERIKALKSVNMNVEFNSDFMGQVSGEIILTRDKPYNVFGISKLKMIGIAITSKGSRPISMSFDGQAFSYLDAEKNELVVIDDPTYTKIGRSGQLTYGMAIPAIYYEAAFVDSLMTTITKYEQRPDTLIFDQPAYAVKIIRNVYDKFKDESHQIENTWYFHKQSFLPLGISGKGIDNFYKIKEIDKEYIAADFNLTGDPALKQVSQSPSEVVYLDLNSTAPDWTLPSNKSKSITLSKLKGKVVMLDFWGTWCVPCLKSMPHVQSIYDHFKDQPVEVIGVSVEMENAVDVPAYVKRLGYTYPIALNGKIISKDYKLSEFPTIYILDKNRKIIFAGRGDDLEKKKDIIIQVIQSALKK